MPRLSIEPRPYSLIRAQKCEPLFFFLARCISSISLYNCFGDTTTRAPLLLPPSLCCHRRVLPLATLLRPVVAPIGQCLSLSLQLFRRPSTTTRAPLLLPPTLCFHGTVSPLATLLRPPSLHLFFLHLHFVHEHFLFFSQLSRRSSSKVNFQCIFVLFSVLYMLIFNFSYCEC